MSCVYRCVVLSIGRSERGNMGGGLYNHLDVKDLLGYVVVFV